MRRKDLELTEEAENFEALCNGYEDRISQLERDNAALMEVARSAVRRFRDGSRAMQKALDALPAHIKDAVHKGL